MHQSDFFGADARSDLPTLVSGKGADLRDVSGKPYLDAASGAVLTNLGQGNRRVIRAMRQQARELSFTYVRNSRHLPNERLANKLEQSNNSGLDAVYLSTDGSDAIEAAIKMARIMAVGRGQESKTHVISLRPSYHGATLATLPLSGDPGYAVYTSLGCMATTQVDSPFAVASKSGDLSIAASDPSLDLLSDELERLGSEDVLALVVEPVGGVSNGAYTLPSTYLTGLRELSRRHGMWLIFDEIMAHIRTGWFLISDRLDPDDRPDFVAIGKGLGAGYVPISATLTTSSILEEVVAGSGFNLSHTYNANPISCAAAIAVLDEVERLDLLAKAHERGEQIMRALDEMKQEGLPIKDVRGEGLLIAIHLDDSQSTAGISPSALVRRLALDNGLLVYARDTHNGMYGHWVMVTPPMTISHRQVDRMVSCLRKTLELATKELSTRARQPS